MYLYCQKLNYLFGTKKRNLDWPWINFFVIFTYLHLTVKLYIKTNHSNWDCYLARYDCLLEILSAPIKYVYATEWVVEKLIRFFNDFSQLATICILIYIQILIMSSHMYMYIHTLVKKVPRNFILINRTGLVVLWAHDVIKFKKELYWMVEIFPLMNKNHPKVCRWGIDITIKHSIHKQTRPEQHGSLSTY